ncbi:cation transporter protein, putative [Trypanosoma cruzi marinkellei]|uniref:Cation transporter protein, putative n=1 Tax=Trypanosoma cruzi marinkellei TaxID=85056 RepID=K2NAT1_TRYCR|nr:cation transporter protein, putative [Trypanosoma cruzi marinkellei]
MLSFVVAAGFAGTILAQSFILHNSQAHFLWVGGLVSVGEALIYLVQIRENARDAYKCFFLHFFNAVLMGTFRACICGFVLYILREIEPMFSILIYCAFVLQVDYLQAENLRNKLFWFGVSALSILFLFLGILIKKNGDIALLTFAFAGLVFSVLVANFFEVHCSRGINSWLRFFEQVFASVELSIFGWLFFFVDRTFVSSYPWLLFPILSIISGCGKALFDLRFGATPVTFAVNEVLVLLLGGCILNIGFRTVDYGDFLAMISACIFLLCFLNSMYCNNGLPLLEPSSYFLTNRNGVLAFVGDAFNFFFQGERERRLFSFFLLTVAVMVLELLYGISANSLGLVSDSFHMLLDSVSIAVGLFAAFASSLPGDKMTHPFGYARYRVLGGFINAVLLLFIALFVVVESVERIMNPPDINAAYLIHVSVVGLIVNIVGVAFFHGVGSHSHSHGGCSGSVDHNLRGIYLHILADLVGSINVMISSIVISLTGTKIIDPICSLFSCVFIALSAFPLLEETGKVLLLGGHPYDEENFLKRAIAGIKDIEDVNSVENICAWPHSTAPNELAYCAIRVLARARADHSKIRFSVTHFMRNFFKAETGSYHLNIIVHVE